MQIGGGLAGSAVAALFADPYTATTAIMPGLALLSLLSYGLLRVPASRRGHPAKPARPEDLEVAVDPVALIGAGGEEIEEALHQRRASGRKGG